ncbi:ribbon-helix-helix domain-containing protein [Vibrio breoganii]
MSKPSLADLQKKKQANNDSKIASDQNIKLSNNDTTEQKRTAQQIIRMYPDAKKQLKLMAVEQDESVNSLLTKAINELFVKHKKQPIA